MTFEFPNIKEDDFHDFRSKGLGGSDMGSIMGVSPYRTKLQLWLEKTGIKPRQNITNYAMQRGTDLEPMIRKWYNATYDVNMKPERKVSDECEYIRCNADGVDNNARRMIEIKAGGLEDHESGIIPEKYYPQCVYLSLVFGYPLNYVSYSDNEKASEKYKVILLEYTLEYAAMLMMEVHAFWESIQTKTKPPITEKDDVYIDDSEVVELVETYSELKAEYDETERKLKSVQKILSSRVTHNRSICNHHRLSWVTRKTGVKYFTIKRLSDERDL